jgi:RNA polymerase sigma factor (sigma-70 family)
VAPTRPSERPTDDGPLVRAFFEKRDNLLLFLAARTRCMATAEDLLQDLYLKVAAAEQADADVRAPSALLYRMAANVLVDHVRSVQRASRRNADWRRETRTSVADEEVTAEVPADEAVIAKERVRQLAEAVAELPPQMGRAFKLHKLEGFSQKDTAQAMGVSTKMIEQHIQAAVRRLTERLRS